MELLLLHINANKGFISLGEQFFCKGKDTLRNFSVRVFHEMQFQEHFMKHKMLS